MNRVIVQSVVASFANPAAAKSAMAALERDGVRPGDIHVLTASPAATRGGSADADARTARWATSRVIAGAVIGGVIGAVAAVVVVVLAVDGSLYPAWLGALVGGGIAGAAVGALVSFGASAPRTPAAWRTYELGHAQETCLAVRAHRSPAAEAIAAVLVGQGGTDVRTTET